MTALFSPPKRRSVGEGLFAGTLDMLDDLHLAGIRCRVCSATSFGRVELCPNCGAPDVEPIALCRQGALVTYSVLRHAPPGNYRGPRPYVPFAIGLVSLPEGVAVVAPLDVVLDEVTIGMPLTLAPHILYCDEDGTEVVAFAFTVDRKAA